MIRTLVREAVEQAGGITAGPRSDFDLNPSSEGRETRSMRSAAVLIPIVDRGAAPTVLLTRRSEKLAKHAGQISFPGGKIDPVDADAAAAALRELQEETAIPPAVVEPMGRLDRYHTVTDFDITPIVAVLEPDFQAVPEPGEVAEIFEVPLGFILNRANHKRESAEWKGRVRHYYAMPYGRHYIWGATAAMLINLVDVLEPVMKQYSGKDVPWLSS